MGTNTTNYSLYKPVKSEIDWDALVNANMDVIDAELKNRGAHTQGDGLAVPVDYIDFDATGEMVFHGAAGMVFAEMYVKNNVVETSIGGAGTYVQITVFAVNGLSKNCTPDHTNDHITIGEAGIYEVIVHLHIESIGAGAADLVAVELRKNNGTTVYDNVHGHRKLAGGGGDVGSMSIGGIVDVAATDTLELWITNEDNATNLLVADANIHIKQLAGT